MTEKTDRRTERKDRVTEGQTDRRGHTDGLGGQTESRGPTGGQKGQTEGGENGQTGKTDRLRGQTDGLTDRHR